jgi:hypothetical protein
LPSIAINSVLLSDLVGIIITSLCFILLCPLTESNWVKCERIGLVQKEKSSALSEQAP